MRKYIKRFILIVILTSVLTAYITNVILSLLALYIVILYSIGHKLIIISDKRSNKFTGSPVVEKLLLMEM